MANVGLRGKGAKETKGSYLFAHESDRFGDVLRLLSAAKSTNCLRGSRIQILDRAENMGYSSLCAGALLGSGWVSSVAALDFAPLGAKMLTMSHPASGSRLHMLDKDDYLIEGRFRLTPCDPEPWILLQKERAGASLKGGGVPKLNLSYSLIDISIEALFSVSSLPLQSCARSFNIRFPRIHIT